MNTLGNEFQVDAATAGSRLDHTLALLLPHTGLRGRKRAIEGGHVRVNGRLRPPAHKVRCDDVITLDAACFSDVDSAPKAAAAGATDDPVRLLGIEGRYCFFYKPACLHTAALAGGKGASLEAELPKLWAAREQELAFDDDEVAPLPMLLQRLDFATSGIVCAALDAPAQRAFRHAERLGRCEKRYLAVLLGCMEASATATTALRSDDRRKSLSAGVSADPTRWTEFFPLAVLRDEAAVDLLMALEAGRAQGHLHAQPNRAVSAEQSDRIGQPEHADQPEHVAGAAMRNAFADTRLVKAAALAKATGLTLAGCRIRRGARHQIRAHAAELGYALFGDSLYGPEDEKNIFGPDEAFFLHHGAMTLPGAFCALLPTWALPESLRRQAQAWLDKPGG